MKPDRILHVPRRFVAHEWGGTETVVASLALEQRKMGFRPEIHTSLALSSDRRGDWKSVPIRRYGYQYPFVGLNAEQKVRMDKKGGNLLSFSLFWALARAGSTRIFHAHALKRLGGEVFTAARLQRKPFVVTLHGGVFDVPQAELNQMMEPQAGKFEWGKVFGALCRSRRILEEADAIICVGRSEFDHAAKSLGHDRIYHVGNGVDADRFAVGDEGRFRAAHNIPSDALVMACYSRFDPQKDQNTLIEAFDRLAPAFPSLHLVLAGPMTVPSFVEALDARILASPHRHRIRRLGPFDFIGTALTDAYHGCDIFVLPSRHEPFGIVVLEAWSAGKPVVVSRVGGLQHLVAEEADGLFFASGNAEECAAQARRLLESSELRRRMGTTGCRKARESYSWRQIANQTEEIYQRAEARRA